MRRFWNVFKRLCAKYPAIFYFFYGRRSEALPPAARNLLIDGTWFRLHQLKYFFRDRVWKRPYKVIDWRGEFGAEIKWAVPFAYWHHLNGTLKKTISSKDTTHFYYFSQDHTEIDRQRKYLTTPEVPNSEDHNFEYDFSKWERVPFREKYANQLGITFEKPLLIISNKYNTEWSKEPVNFLDLDALIQICRMVGPDYQICYNRPGSSLISEDNSSILDLDELLLKIAELTNKIVPYEIFAIFLLDEKKEELYLRFAIGHPPELFKEAFELARTAGLAAVPHAGEIAGAESIWGALEVLHAQRIGHGVRCLEDARLVEYLRAHQIPLEVCPTSNVCLGVAPSFAAHPLPRLLAEGLYVTLNSDDPPMFNTTLTNEYLRAAEAFGFDAERLETLALNAVHASLLPEAERQQMEQAFRQIFVALRAELDV